MKAITILIRSGDADDDDRPIATSSVEIHIDNRPIYPSSVDINNIYIYIYIYITHTHTPTHIDPGPFPARGAASAARRPGPAVPRDALLGIHYRGVQWEVGAVDGGSIIQ